MSAPAPFTPKPSIIDRVLGRLFPTDQYGGLLEPTEQRALQRQGLLQLGTGLLADTGPGNALSALGRSYQGIDFGGMADHALKLQAYRAQLGQQQSIAEVVAQHPPVKGEKPADTYSRLTAIVADLAGQPGTEDLIGKLSNVLAQIKPSDNRGDWELRAGLVDRNTGLPTTNAKDGVPAILRVNKFTGEVVPTSAGAIIPSLGGGVPTEGERRAGALYTVAEDAYNKLKNAQAPNLGDYLAGKIPAGLGQGMISSRQQLQNQAGAQFYRSYLYIVSGATVNPNEAEEAAKTFVPQWGDDPELVKQKLQTQEVMVQSMRQAMGRATPPPAQVPKAPAQKYRAGNPFAPK